MANRDRQIERAQEALREKEQEDRALAESGRLESRERPEDEREEGSEPEAEPPE